MIANFDPKTINDPSEIHVYTFLVFMVPQTFYVYEVRRFIITDRDFKHVKGDYNKINVTFNQKV